MIIQKIKFYFNAKRIAKLMACKENPNYVKITQFLDTLGSVKVNARMSFLRKEIMEILLIGKDFIADRYTSWKTDFTNIGNDTDDTGNIFPGTIFESPFFCTKDFLVKQMMLNVIGILVLSGKYNPQERLTLRVVKIEPMTYFSLPIACFKIIKDSN